MFLFPPEISAEKEIEDWEPPLLQSFWPFFFLFFFSNVLSVLLSKSLLFLHSIILNADAVKSSYSSGLLHSRTHAGSTLHGHLITKNNSQ